MFRDTGRCAGRMVVTSSIGTKRGSHERTGYGGKSRRTGDARCDRSAMMKPPAEKESAGALFRLAGPGMRAGGIRPIRPSDGRRACGRGRRPEGGRIMENPPKGLGPVYQARRRMNRRVYLAEPLTHGLGSSPCQTPPDMPWPFCSEMPISSNCSGL